MIIKEILPDRIRIAQAEELLVQAARRLRKLPPNNDSTSVLNEIDFFLQEMPGAWDGT